MYLLPVKSNVRYAFETDFGSDSRNIAATTSALPGEENRQCKYSFWDYDRNLAPMESDLSYSKQDMNLSNFYAPRYQTNYGTKSATKGSNSVRLNDKFDSRRGTEP